MATEERRESAAIEDRLFSDFFRYSFFSAVHLLETISPGKERLGAAQTPQNEAVRFRVKPGFAFPPSDIVDLRRGGDESALPEMAVAFLGLIGPSGLLPHWYNDLAIARNRDKDFTLTAFFDIFHHRFISLFYLAWKKHQFPVNFLPGARDKLSRHLLSLCGLGTPGLEGRIGFAEESLSFYSGLLSRHVPSASSISATVAHFSGCDTSIDQFIERLIPMAAGDITRMGQANSRLGADTIMGTSVWEGQTKFRLRLGPMDLRAFVRFLPSGDMHLPTFSLVRYMVGIEYEFEIRFYLRREEVPPCQLGGKGSMVRLGWSTWMKSPEIGLPYDPHVTFQEESTL